MQDTPDSTGQTSAPSAIPYGHLTGWTIATSVALGAVAFLLALLAESAIADARNQSEVQAQIFVARSDLATVHARFVTLTRGVIVLSVLTAFLWLAWQYQAHANLRALGPSRIHPWLAVALWLIPGLGVVLALVGLGDLWVGSDPVRGDRRAGRASFPLALVLWWASFAATVTLAVLALARAFGRGAQAADLIARDHLLVAACLTGIAAAVLGMVLLSKLDGRLDLKEDAAGHPSWRNWSDGRRSVGASSPTPAPPNGAPGRS